jgi:hypothetical protein
VRGFIQQLFLQRGKYGPAPRFAPEDAMRAFWRLERRTGRAALARALGIGEGTARTVLRSLYEKGLIDSAPSGHKLTAKGFTMLQKLRRKVISLKRIPASQLTFGLPASAVQLRGVRVPIKVLVLRDEMVRCGLSGCTMLRFERGRLIIPPFYASMQAKYAPQLSALAKQFLLEEGDILIIGYGGSEADIERALWRACSLLHV